ncbi:MAG: ABC transporter ATP-binding protein [bacterium]
MAHLKIDSISLQFGGVKALHDVSIEIEGREIFSLIGPNGSGKTSLINCITRFYRPQEGSIIFNKQDITGFSSHKIAKLGISRTFQNIELFRGMSVLDNIKLGRVVNIGIGVFSAGIYIGKGKKDELENRLEAEKIIELLEIEDIRREVVGKLPYGKQKLVELGRALISRPKLLLLDEPTAGMNTEETNDLIRFVLNVHHFWDITILLIEHKMDLVMDVSKKIFVLDFGRKIAEGSPQEIIKNPDVVSVYLGKKEDNLIPGEQ